jgi:hypothetical protein
MLMELGGLYASSWTDQLQGGVVRQLD